jgi:hypothetical protein
VRRSSVADRSHGHVTAGRTADSRNQSRLKPQVRSSFDSRSADPIEGSQRLRARADVTAEGPRSMEYGTNCSFVTELGVPTTVEDSYRDYMGKRFDEVVAAIEEAVGGAIPQSFGELWQVRKNVRFSPR